MNRRIWIAAAALALAGCRSTGPTEVGIKVGKIFGGDAVVQPGQTVIVIPVLHDWYVFDSKTQTLEMKANPDGNGGDELDFKTRDGNNIGVDVTVLYHLDPMKAPDLLRTVAPSMADVRLKLVRPLARTIPRDALNELSSEEFYESDKRSQKEQQALDNMQKALEPYGIVCERVVLGNYRFNHDYQAAIDAKKVADQEVNKNRSQADAAKQEWEANLEATKGQVAQLIASENGKAQQVHLQADAYYAAKQQEADAILAEKTDNAKGIEKMRDAMNGAGGRTMVKLRIADALKGKRIVLVPMSDSALNLQKTDINQYLQTMGIGAAADDSSSSSSAPATSGGAK